MVPGAWSISLWYSHVVWSTEPYRAIQEIKTRPAKYKDSGPQDARFVWCADRGAADAEKWVYHAGMGVA